MAYDDPNTMWWYVKVQVQVEEVRRANVRGTIDVMFSVSGGLDPDVALEGYADLGRGLLLLTDWLADDDPHGPWMVLEDGSLLLTVDEDGALHAPFLAEDRAERLLARINTLPTLRGSLP